MATEVDSKPPWLIGGAIAAIVILAGLGWHFRQSVPLLRDLVGSEAAIGTAVVLQADARVFSKATESSPVVSLVSAGQPVELLQLPTQPGEGGLLWSKIRFGSKNHGFIDTQQLGQLSSTSDATQYQLLMLQLHGLNLDEGSLRSEVSLLLDFLRRFPGSARVGEVKLATADRSAEIAARLIRDSNPGGPDFEQGLTWSQQALKYYQELVDSHDAAVIAQATRGAAAAQQTASMCDAKLNPLPVARLDADAPSISKGQSVTLTWSTENAQEVTLLPGIGVVGPEGSRTLYPSDSTTYRLVVKGTRDQIETTAAVHVAAPAPTVSLTATPSTVRRGQAILLSWSSSNALDLNLSPTPGKVALSGSTPLVPTGSTNYQISARGKGGTAQAEAFVTVVEPPSVAPPPPVVVPPAPPTTVMIPGGTVFSVRLVDALDTRTNHRGDTFRASLDEPVVIDGREVVPRYAHIVGRVTDVTSAGRASGVAQMSLTLSELRIGSASYPLSTGSIPFWAEPQKGKDAGKIATGAGVGALIGAIVGGSKGAAIGAGAGGAAGTGAVLATRGQALRLESEKLINFHLEQPLTLRVSQ